MVRPVRRDGGKGALCLPETRKMEALARLSCRVAHDYNNILASIEGYAALAMKDVRADGPLAKDLREIRGSVAKAAALSRKLVVFAGRQALDKAPCCANEIIARTLERAELSATGGLTAETRLEPSLPGIIADAAQLEQAVLNLLLNARDAMGGGTALISSRALELEGSAVNSPDPLKAGALFVKISVRDSGGGISADVLERLFEPLFSGRKNGRGAGLGLSLVYGVVKQHNGWVEVKSEPGRGSEFSLYLPAAPGAGAAEKSPVSLLQPAANT